MIAMRSFGPKPYKLTTSLLCLCVVAILFAGCSNNVQETVDSESDQPADYSDEHKEDTNAMNFKATPDRTISGLIGIAENQWDFQELASRETYVPFGTNYYDPNTGWAPRLWEQFDEAIVEQHFKQLQSIHVNVARLFFTLTSFMPRANEVDETALQKFDQVIALAKKYEIKLLMSGPDFWEGTPAWYAGGLFASDYVMENYEHFWRVIGERYADEPAIFAWDLYNEPQIGWGEDGDSSRKWRRWLKDKYGSIESLQTAWGPIGESEQDFEFIDIPARAYSKDDPKLYDYQLFREELAVVWAERMVRAIRTHDQNHLVTIGMVNPIPFEDVDDPAISFVGFNPHKLKHVVDFTSVHYYPLKRDPWAMPGNMELELNRLMMWLRYCYVGQPIMIGEFGWYGGGPVDSYAAERTQEDQATWSRAVVESSIGNTTAWATWPAYDSPSATDISKHGGLFDIDGNLKKWGEAFRELALSGKLVQPRAQGDVVIELPMWAMYTDYPAQQAMFQHVMDLLMQDAAIEFKPIYK